MADGVLTAILILGASLAAAAYVINGQRGGVTNIGSTNQKTKSSLFEVIARAASGGGSSGGSGGSSGGTGGTGGTGGGGGGGGSRNSYPI